MGQLDTQAPLGIRQRLAAALEQAQTDGQDVKASVLRLVHCAIRDRDATARAEDRCLGCEETVIADLLRMMVGQRVQAAQALENEGRIPEAEREREEMDVLLSFLPAPMSEADLKQAAAEIVGELDARSLKDIGRCVSELKSRYPEQIDPARANSAVKSLLL
jgi:uncharacterized protein